MILDIVCKKHPEYKAMRSPLRNKNTKTCDACLILWFLSTRDYGARQVGVAQEGLANDPAGILVNRRK